MDGVFCTQKGHFLQAALFQGVLSDKKMATRKGTQAHLCRTKVFGTNSQWLVRCIRISSLAQTPLWILVQCGWRIEMLTLEEGARRHTRLPGKLPCSGHFTCIGPLHPQISPLGGTILYPDSNESQANLYMCYMFRELCAKREKL